MRGKYRERARTIITGIVDRVFVLSNAILMVGVGLITKLTTLPIEVAIAKIYILRYGFLFRKVWALHCCTYCRLYLYNHALYTTRHFLSGSLRN